MYTKYVRRGGKLCGPYAYTSKRVGHSVQSVYLGKVGEGRIFHSIVRRGKQWVVMDKKKTRVLGRHPSYKKALAQLQAIEISKRMRHSIASDFKKAKRITEMPDNGEYVVQQKLDGMRVKIFNDEKGFRIINRLGKDVTKKFPELTYLRNKLPKDTVIDGELVVRGVEGRESLKAIQEHKSPATFEAFDILQYRGKDLEKKPFTLREKFLKTINESENFKIMKTYPLKDAKRLMRDKHAEGVVFKKKDSVYDDKRDSGWLKLKRSADADVVITGYEPGKGKRKGAVGALKIGVSERGTIKDLGKVGTGFTDQEAKDLKKRLDKGEKLFAKVQYLRKGTRGRLREPVFAGLREDIDLTMTHASSKPAPHPETKQERLAEDVVRVLKPFSKRIQVAGSIRRGEPKHKDIDIVAIPKDKEKIRLALKFLGGKKIIDGEQKMSYRINGTPVEVYFAKPENWGGMMVYATGARGHTIGFRKKAKEMGYRMDQNGVWKGKKLIAGRTEREIWKVLERPKYKQPWERYSVSPDERDLLRSLPTQRKKELAGEALMKVMSRKLDQGVDITPQVGYHGQSKPRKYSVKHPQAIGSKWSGKKYIHGPRRKQPGEFKNMITVSAEDKKFTHLLDKKLPKGSKLIVGKLKKTDEWAIQSTLTPKQNV